MCNSNIQLLRIIKAKTLGNKNRTAISLMVKKGFIKVLNCLNRKIENYETSHASFFLLIHLLYHLRDTYCFPIDYRQIYVASVFSKHRPILFILYSMQFLEKWLNKGNNGAVVNTCQAINRFSSNVMVTAACTQPAAGAYSFCCRRFYSVQSFAILSWLRQLYCNLSHRNWLYHKLSLISR